MHLEKITDQIQKCSKEKSPVEKRTPTKRFSRRLDESPKKNKKADKGNDPRVDENGRLINAYAKSRMGRKTTLINKVTNNLFLN